MVRQSTSDSEVRIANPAPVVIFVALEMMIRTFEQTRILANQGQSKVNTGIGTTQFYAKQLTHAERLEVERAVDDFIQDRDGHIDDALKVITDDIDHNEHAERVYPFSPELQAATFRLKLGETEAKLAEQFLGRFRENFGKTAYAVALLTIGNKEEISALTGRAHLPIQVRAFEEFLGALVRMALFKEPEGLGDLPSIPFAVHELYGANHSTADIKRWAIDQRVDEFIRSGPVEWRNQIERWTGVNVASLGEWATIHEAWIRRRLYSRSSGRIDPDYYNAVPDDHKDGIRLGGYVHSDAAYIDAFLVETETISICLAIKWIDHFFGLDTNLFPGLFSRIVDMEDAGRWNQAAKICETVVENLHPDHEDVEIARINLLYCRQEMGISDQPQLDRIRSWNPSSMEAQIGRLALLRDYQGLAKTLRRYLTGPKTTVVRSSLEAAPLIRRAIRESPDVKRAFGKLGSAKEKYSKRDTQKGQR